MKKIAIAAIFAFVPTIACAGWESMGPDQRLAWASRQVARICGPIRLVVSPGERNMMRTGIMIATPGMVQSAIASRCPRRSAQR